jgi:hypothetical protein
MLYSLGFMMFASGTLFGVAKLCGIVTGEMKNRLP